VERFTTDGLSEVFSDNGIFQHLWMMGFSLLAGIAGHLERMKKNNQKTFSFMIFISDLITSGFVGLLSLYACLAMCTDIYTMAVIVGMSAHSGTKGLGFVLKFITGKFKVSVSVHKKENDDNKR